LCGTTGNNEDGVDADADDEIMYGGVVVVVVVFGGGVGVDADDDHHDDDDDVGDTSKHILELQAGTFRSYVAHTKCIVL